MTPVRALSQAPLSTLALVAQRSPQEMRRRLAAEGVSSASAQQSLAELAGPDLRPCKHILEKLLVQAAPEKS